MTTPPPERDESAELRRIVLDAAGVGDLHASVGVLIEEVRGLRGDITRHPHLDEVEQRIGVVFREIEVAERRAVQRRRRSAFWLAVAIVFTVQVHDQHIDRCGPGAFLKTEARQATVEKVAEKGAAYHFACDATAPFHTHDGDPYPSGGNVAGWAMYVFAAAGGWVWVRRARPL